MADNLFAENAPDGFRLDFFQLYNWGIFNGTIYTVDAKNKSTLLTGENGSGKTTLVDALMTLLVPQNMRFYNQSSGSTKKKDRRELGTIKVVRASTRVVFPEPFTPVRSVDLLSAFRV